MGQISSMTVPPYGHNFNHIIADFTGIVKRIMAKNALDPLLTQREEPAHHYHVIARAKPVAISWYCVPVPTMYQEIATPYGLAMTY